MSYTALYRKFRPATFEDVKGQEHIVTTLKNQIISKRTSHAYLFCGTRGTGKTTIAKILAKAVNCENPVNGSPCGECAICKSIASGSSMNVIEIDAASNNGVDNVRQIIEEVAYSPAEGSYKVYIIDEVHMLSSGAFNALLKTLEEPPSYAMFILATTEVHKIPITILSRCQRYDFHRITIDTISARIQELADVEGLQIEEQAIRYIAKVADGSMRDALSLLDQCIAFYFEQELTYDKVLEVLGAVDTEVFSRTLRAVISGDVLETLRVLEEIIQLGKEPGQFVTDLTWYLRNLLLIKNADGVEEILDISHDNLLKLKEESDMVDNETIMRYIRILSDLSGKIRFATQKRILIEVALIRLCKPVMDTDTEALSDRIRQVEDKLENGVFIREGQGLNSQSEMPRGDNEGKRSGAEVRKAPLPKAVPEDIREIVSQWGNICSQMAPPGNAILRDTYPSLGEENTLRVVLQNTNNTYSSNYFKDPENKEKLEEHIALCIGKEVKVEIVSTENQRDPEELHPNLLHLLENQLGVEIELEDD